MKNPIKEILYKYLETHRDNELIDWNNFDDHIVAGALSMLKKKKSF